MVPGMWMKEYILLIHVMAKGCWRKNCWIGSSQNRWRDCSSSINWRACLRATWTVPWTRVTAVNALPSW